MKQAAYIATTSLIVIAYAGAGIAYLMDAPQIVQNVARLGYPLSFLHLLGFWKVVGAVTLATPRLARFKEWAYAAPSRRALGVGVVA